MGAGAGAGGPMNDGARVAVPPEVKRAPGSRV